MKYVKLGEKAYNFTDPISGINLAGKEVVEATPQQLASPKMKRAIKGNHLEMATKDEFDAWEKEKAKTAVVSEDAPVGSDKKLLDKISKLEKANEVLKESEADLKGEVSELKGQIETLEEGKEDPKTLDDLLVEYFKNEFEVKAADVKKFQKLSTEKKISELNALGEE